MDWFAEEGYAVWGLFWLAAFFAALIYLRRNPDSVGARIFFTLVPFTDPTDRTPTSLTPRAIVLWLIGMLIVLLAVLFVPGFA